MTVGLTIGLPLPSATTRAKHCANRLDVEIPQTDLERTTCGRAPACVVESAPNKATTHPAVTNLRNLDSPFSRESASAGSVRSGNALPDSTQGRLVARECMGAGWPIAIGPKNASS